MNGTTLCSPICGDGLLMIGEECDSYPEEGCNTTCTGSLLTWTCSGGNLTSPSICEPICGDG